jgi:ABC-type transport system involved in Fe-S cluster assembly fused permease/ATPase subunit
LETFWFYCPCSHCLPLAFTSLFELVVYCRLQAICILHFHWTFAPLMPVVFCHLYCFNVMTHFYFWRVHHNRKINSSDKIWTDIQSGAKTTLILCA